MKKIPRSTIIPVLLLIYLAVMSYIGFGDYASGKSTPLYYFGVIAVTLLCIFLLHLSLKRKERFRRKNEED